MSKYAFAFLLIYFIQLNTPSDGKFYLVKTEGNNQGYGSHDGEDYDYRIPFDEVLNDL